MHQEKRWLSKVRGEGGWVEISFRALLFGNILEYIPAILLLGAE